MTKPLRRKSRQRSAIKERIEVSSSPSLMIKSDKTGHD